MNRKGSILLYVIFLSAFLILFFASFGRGFDRLLDRGRGMGQTTEEQSNLKNQIALLKQNPVASYNFSDGRRLTSLDYDGSVFSGVLSDSETREYWVIGTGSSLTLTLSVADNIPVGYRLAGFSSGSVSNASIITSGVATSGQSIVLSGALDRHVLVLKNLGGVTRYTLSTGGNTVFPDSDLYKLTRTIGSYEQFIQNIPVQNFGTGTVVNSLVY